MCEGVYFLRLKASPTIEAQSLVSDLELCWGSLPIHRPNGDHRYGICTCPSRGITIEAKGRIKTWKINELDTVVETFSRHFNMHPLIPDQNGTYRSTDEIHRACAAEIYHWCKPRNCFRLWAYLWVNWYQPGNYRVLENIFLEQLGIDKIRSLFSYNNHLTQSICSDRGLKP